MSNVTFEMIHGKIWQVNLTPQAQSSLQGTFGVWTDVKVLWTQADEGDAGM